MLNRVPRISTFLFSLLLLISFAAGPVFADSGSNPQDVDAVIEKIRTHMQIVTQDNPGIDQKAQETEQQLLTGVISPREACSNCHVKP
jgi:hypothetical protein